MSSRNTSSVLRKAQRRRYYLKNREKIIQKVSDYNSSRKDQKALADKERYTENRQKVLERVRTYASSERGMATRETLKQRRSEFAKLHPSRSMYDGMIARCYNVTFPKYPNYGGRGISVCERWLGVDGYDRLCEDLGPRPEGIGAKGNFIYTVDRIDVEGDYEPDNCRWADKYVQAKNKRKDISFLEMNLIHFQEKDMNLSEFSRLTRINSNVVIHRWLQHPYCTDWIMYSDVDNRRYEWDGHLYNLEEIALIATLPFHVASTRLTTLGWSVDKTIRTPILMM